MAKSNKTAASTKTASASKAEKEAATMARKEANIARAASKTAEAKAQRRIDAFLNENGEELSSAGHNLEGLSLQELKAILAQHRESLLAQAKAQAKAVVRGFNPTSFKEAVAAVEANPPLTTADLEVADLKKGLEALKALIADLPEEVEQDAPAEEVEVIANLPEEVEDGEAPMVTLAGLKGYAKNQGHNFWSLKAAFGFDQAKSWGDLLTLMNEAGYSLVDKEDEEEEAVDSPVPAVEETTEDNPVTPVNPEEGKMIYKEEEGKSMREVVFSRVEKAHRIDEVAVKKAAETAAKETLSLLNKLLRSYEQEAEAKIVKTSQASAEAEAAAKAVEGAIASFSAQHGIPATLLAAELEAAALAKAAKEEAEAKAKAEAEALAKAKAAQETLLKGSPVSISKVKELILNLEEHGEEGMANLLKGLVNKFLSKKAKFLLSKADLKEMMAQEAKAKSLLNAKVRGAEFRTKQAEAKKAQEEFQANAVAWLLNGSAAFLGEEAYAAAMKNGGYSLELGKAYKEYLKQKEAADKAKQQAAAKFADSIKNGVNKPKVQAPKKAAKTEESSN